MVISTPTSLPRHSASGKTGGTTSRAGTRFTRRPQAHLQDRMAITTTMLGPTLGDQSTFVRQRVFGGLRVFSGITMAMTVRWTTGSSWAMGGLKG